MNRKEDLNVNLQNQDGESALLLACKFGRINFVQLLLEKISNININLQDEFGFTALLYAATNGFLEIIEILLQEESNHYFSKLIFLFITK